MQKISIKREQSQAGLSFAEREKFRPQVKNKLFLLLALLLTAATGAMAQVAITTDLADSYDAKVGIPITLSIEATNAQYYQWYKKYPQGEGMIMFATSSSYTFTPKEAGETKLFCRVMGNNDEYVESKITTVIAAVPPTYSVSLKDNVKDADKWTVSPNPAEEGQTVTLQYTGRLKVKGVKATSDAAAKEAATVTTAPTGAAIVGVGKTTALVSGGAADGGTLMYKVTTENTKPASTDGFSDAVPTAQGITASGKVYVWYYVKGDDTHSDSEIAGPVSVTLAEEITWNTTNVFNSSHNNDKLTFIMKTPLVYEGITISYSGDDAASQFYSYINQGGKGRLKCYGQNGAKFTFTAPSGKKFVRIEMTDDNSAYSGDANWIEIEDENKLVWSGTPSNTVEIAGDDMTSLSTLNTIAFYLSE